MGSVYSSVCRENATLHITNSLHYWNRKERYSIEIHWLGHLGNFTDYVYSVFYYTHIYIYICAKIRDDSGFTMFYQQVLPDTSWILDYPDIHQGMNDMHDCMKHHQSVNHSTEQKSKLDWLLNS